ncbi:MAG: hypothetical protein MZV63_27995 [Marinilabiliales bacterium]|nr:hypothetical protein [Marinilabiliales bacterium]
MNALIFTIIGSFVTMMILLLVILLNRNRMEKEAKLRQYLLEQYQSLIIDYLFGNTSSEAFRKIASDDYRRQVLIDQMIDVSVNLKGDSEEKLMKLYMELEPRRGLTCKGPEPQVAQEDQGLQGAGIHGYQGRKRRDVQISQLQE